MVDALRECWRLLEPGGTLLDLRPIGATTPVERFGPDGASRIGELDGSPAWREDGAARRALDQVVADGLYCLAESVTFELNIYWHRPEDLFHHLDNVATRRKLPSGRELLRLSRAPAYGTQPRLRTRERMQLGTYRRTE